MNTEIKDEFAALVTDLRTKRARQEALWSLQESKILQVQGGEFGGEDITSRIRKTPTEQWRTNAASKAFNAMLDNLQAELRLARTKSIVVLTVTLLFFVAFLSLVVLAAISVLRDSVAISTAQKLIAAISPLLGGGLFGWYLRLERYRSDLGTDLRKLLEFVTRVGDDSRKSASRA